MQVKKQHLEPDMEKWTGWISLQSKGLSRVFSNTTVQKPVDVGNLISGSSAFSKSSLNIWEVTVHVLLKPGLKNFERYFTSV